MKKIAYKIVVVVLCYTLTNLSIYAQQTLIKSGDTWDYFDNGYLDIDWAEKADLYTWKKGASPLGYGDDQVTTTISFGDNEEKKEIVEYFKKDINIKSNEFIGFEFRLLRDDGAIVYINGKELYRSNMQQTTITRSIRPIRIVSSSDETMFHINVFDNNIFKDGKNTIAIAVYQAYDDSSDLIFDFELIGHTSNQILKELISEKDVANKDLQYKLNELSTKLELEQIKNQNELLKYSNSNLKTFLLILFILFIISLISIYYFVENSKQKTRKFTESLKVKAEDCVKKDKELIYNSTKLLNYKQYFKELKIDVKGIETSDKKMIKNIISEIDTILSSEEEWETLRNHFDAVYAGFYDKLIELHPELSESDLRHCMFIKLHMQTKEIARILLIDPRSVQTTRYRIKKKMNLDEETDLREYLINI